LETCPVYGTLLSYLVIVIVTVYLFQRSLCPNSATDVEHGFRTMEKVHEPNDSENYNVHRGYASQPLRATHCRIALTSLG
jgi:hypothetical protein